MNYFGNFVRIILMPGYIFSACALWATNASADEPWVPAHFPLESTAIDIPAETPEQTYTRFRRFDKVSHPYRYDLYQDKDPLKKTQAILWVSGIGKALIEQQAFFDSGQRLSFAAVQARFGKPRRYGHIAVFDLIGEHWKEPNIFHLDVEFDEENKAQRYLVRGRGIVTESKFLPIDIHQIGKHEFEKPQHRRC